LKLGRRPEFQFLHFAYMYVCWPVICM